MFSWTYSLVHAFPFSLCLHSFRIHNYSCSITGTLLVFWSKDYGDGCPCIFLLDSNTFCLLTPPYILRQPFPNFISYIFQIFLSIALFFFPFPFFIYNLWIPFEFCPFPFPCPSTPNLLSPPFTLSVRCCEGCLRSALCPSVRCPSSRPCWYGRPCAVGLCCRRAGELWCHHLHCGAEALRGPTGHHHLRHWGALRPHNHLQPHQGRPGWEVLLLNCVYSQTYCTISD